MKEIEDNLDIMRNPENGRISKVENGNSPVFAEEMKFIDYLLEHSELGNLFLLFYIFWTLCALLSIPASIPNDGLSIKSLTILPEFIIVMMLPFFVYWSFDYIFLTPDYSNVFVISKNEILQVIPSHERNVDSDYLVQSTFDISNLEDMKYENSNVVLEFDEKKLEVDCHKGTERFQDILYNF